MRRRTAVGIFVVTIAFAAIINPALVPLELGQLFVVSLGVLMLLQAIRIVQVGLLAEAESAVTPDVETPEPVERAGDDLHRTYLSFGGSGGLIPERIRIRSRLREAAIAVVSQTERISLDDASERIENGTWTDDGIASFYLAHGTGSSRSLREALREWVRGSPETDVQQNIRHTVNAVGEYLDLAPLATGTPSGANETDQSSVDLPSDPAADPRLASLGGGLYRRSDQPTGHWAAIGAVAFAFGGIGVVFDHPALLLTGVVGLGFAAYAQLDSAPVPELSLERSLDIDGRVLPGDEIPVTLRITNEGDTRLYDLRIVDGVPAALQVTEGSPRLGTTLQPGESATIEYAVAARRGTHAFRATQLLTRPINGASEQELLALAAAEITCIPPLQPLKAPLPLRERATQFVGNVAAQRGGGVEFFATREYRPGDPLGRIDWNRHARTGELATLEFREERAASVVLVIDTRADAYLGHGSVPEQRTREAEADTVGDNAVERSVTAAGRIVATLLAGGNKVGLASFGPEHCWLSPGLGSDHAVRIEELLGADAAFAPEPPDGTPQPVRWLRQLQRRLPEDTQLIFLTPLPDDYSVLMARRLNAAGHPVTVLSPDPTNDDSVGHRLAFIERRLRVTELRRADIPVIDWPWKQQLDASLRGAARRRR